MKKFTIAINNNGGKALFTDFGYYCWEFSSRVEGMRAKKAIEHSLAKLNKSLPGYLSVVTTNEDFEEGNGDTFPILFSDIKPPSKKRPPMIIIGRMRRGPFHGILEEGFEVWGYTKKRTLFLGYVKFPWWDMSNKQKTKYMDDYLLINSCPEDVVALETKKEAFCSSFKKQGCLVVFEGNKMPYHLLDPELDLSEFSKIRLHHYWVELYKGGEDVWYKFSLRRLNRLKERGEFSTGKRKLSFQKDPVKFIETIERLKRWRKKRMEEDPTREEIEKYLNRNEVYMGSLKRASVNIKIEKLLLKKVFKRGVYYNPLNDRGRPGLYYFRNDGKLPAPSSFLKAEIVGPNGKNLYVRFNHKTSLYEVSEKDFPGPGYEYYANKPSWLTSAD